MTIKAIDCIFATQLDFSSVLLNFSGKRRSKYKGVGIHQNWILFYIYGNFYYILEQAVVGDWFLFD